MDRPESLTYRPLEYWHSPGDGALATEVTYGGEPAFSKVRWPAPERFEQPGPIVTDGCSVKYES